MSYRTSPLFWPFLLIVDAIGYLLFFWLKIARLGEPKRILLIRLEHIGDVLLATPTYRALRKRFPKARIDILVREYTAELVMKNPNIDRVITWNAPWLSKGGSWKGIGQMLRSLNAQRYDLAIDFHGEPRNILLGRLCAKYLVGFGTRGFGFLLNKNVPYGRKHVIDRLLSLAGAVGAGTRDRKMELPLSAADKKYAQTVVTKHKLTNFACIAPGAGPGRTEKLWFNDRWAELADSLIRKGTPVVLIGAKREQPMMQDITRRMQEKNLVDLRGEHTITQSAAVMARANLVLSVDAAAMHIARAIGTPSLALFTSEDPREWGYDEPRFQNIKKPDKHAITTQMVLEKIKSMNVL
jgi:ADP-heptose:LPS heptosyltransferase